MLRAFTSIVSVLYAHFTCIHVYIRAAYVHLCVWYVYVRILACICVHFMGVHVSPSAPTYEFKCSHIVLVQSEVFARVPAALTRMHVQCNCIYVHFTFILRVFTCIWRLFKCIYG